MVNIINRILAAIKKDVEYSFAKNALYVIAILNIIYSVILFRKGSLESTMVLAASITTVFALNALPVRYDRNTVAIGFIYNLMVMVTIMFVNTTNLMTFFIVYELFLLPSALVVWLFSPNKRGMRSTLFFLLWTQLGSVLVLVGILYLRYRLGIVHFFQLKTKEPHIPQYVQFCLLFGFLFKVPTFPFYFWLTKTHVEAFTSFSIFLSGFLVKIAIFGIYKFLPYIGSRATWVGIMLSITGAVLASVTFIFQMDFKKLIAYSTVQEMGVFTALLLLSKTASIEILSLFLITHTLISSMYFYISDCLYKRIFTRSRIAMTGIIYTAPKLAMVVAGSTLFFKGLPFTSKFAAEASFIDVVLIINFNLYLYILIFVFFFGNAAFVFSVLQILMYAPPKDASTHDLTPEDVNFFLITYSLLVFVPFIVL